MTLRPTGHAGDSIGNRRVREEVPAASGALGGSGAGLAPGKGEMGEAASRAACCSSRGILTEPGKEKNRKQDLRSRSATGSRGLEEIPAPLAYRGLSEDAPGGVASLGKKCFARWLVECGRRSGRVSLFLWRHCRRFQVKPGSFVAIRLRAGFRPDLAWGTVRTTSLPPVPFRRIWRIYAFAPATGAGRRNGPSPG